MSATHKEVRLFQNVSLAIAQQCVAEQNRRVLVPLLSFESLSIMARTVGTTAWSSAVVTVRLSNDPDGPWFNVPAGSVTLTAASLTASIDVTPFAYLMLETTTAQSGVVADFAICGFGRK